MMTTMMADKTAVLMIVIMLTDYEQLGWCPCALCQVLDEKFIELEDKQADRSCKRLGSPHPGSCICSVNAIKGQQQRQRKP